MMAWNEPEKAREERGGGVKSKQVKMFGKTV